MINGQPMQDQVDGMVRNESSRMCVHALPIDNIGVLIRHFKFFVDPDMLEVGNGGMTYLEYRSHFSIWALMKVMFSLIIFSLY